MPFVAIANQGLVPRDNISRMTFQRILIGYLKDGFLIAVDEHHFLALFGAFLGAISV